MIMPLKMFMETVWDDFFQNFFNQNETQEFDRNSNTVWAFSSIAKVPLKMFMETALDDIATLCPKL